VAALFFVVEGLNILLSSKNMEVKSRDEKTGMNLGLEPEMVEALKED
jgi:hypothetical protein